jgi:hypothetical protein
MDDSGGAAGRFRAQIKKTSESAQDMGTSFKGAMADGLDAGQSIAKSFSERRDWGDGFYQETGRSFRQQHGPKCKKHQQGIPAPYKNHPQYAGVRTSPGEKI